MPFNSFAEYAPEPNPGTKKTAWLVRAERRPLVRPSRESGPSLPSPRWRDGGRVRLISGGGHDWTKRLPWIVEAASKNRHSQFVIDGEALVLDVDGVSDSNALHSGKSNDEVQLYVFDILAMDGDDLRPLPLSIRKASLAKLLHRRPSGIFLSSFEQGEIGPDLFRHACLMGLEGLVSKRRSQPEMENA